MGRAVGQILLVSAAIAVNFIPGVGQAISGTLVGALGSAGATIATGLTTALSVAGIQSAAGLLGLGPGTPKPEATSTAIKTPRPVRVSAYGEPRLSFHAEIFQ